MKCIDIAQNIWCVKGIFTLYLSFLSVHISACCSEADSWGWDWISACQTKSHSLVQLCWSLTLSCFPKQKHSNVHECADEHSHNALCVCTSKSKCIPVQQKHLTLRFTFSPNWQLKTYTTANVSLRMSRKGATSSFFALFPNPFFPLPPVKYADTAAHEAARGFVARIGSVAASQRFKARQRSFRNSQRRSGDSGGEEKCLLLNCDVGFTDQCCLGLEEGFSKSYIRLMSKIQQ